MPQPKYGRGKDRAPYGGVSVRTEVPSTKFKRTRVSASMKRRATEPVDEPDLEVEVGEAEVTRRPRKKKRREPGWYAPQNASRRDALGASLQRTLRGGR